VQSLGLDGSKDTRLSTIYHQLREGRSLLPKKTYHKDVSQSQLWLPVPLKSIYTYCTRRLLDVWVPNARLERRLWWAGGIVLRDSEVQSPQPVSIGRTMRPSDKHSELA
jgi:hypothetical protein